MEIKEIIVILGMLVTLTLSSLALYKALKVTPKEIKEADVDLSTKYSDLAERSLKRANEAEIKLQEMEKQVELYEKETKQLGIILENHEIEIKTLKDKIAKQEKELKELREKVIAQEAELIELRKALAT